MQTILILGAGLSASSLIKYMLDNASENNWQVRIADRNLDLISKKINGNSAGVALEMNALDREKRLPEIMKADLVISMLPATFHPEIAQDCLDHSKHLITPSYVSAAMQGLHEQAKAKGLVFMNEMGVDPGIDHMSAMQIIDDLRTKGAEIESFKSYCGGLVAPESDNNPWNYKFTWNPRNVVLAGQGGAAQYIEQNQYKYLPSSAIFERIETIAMPGVGNYDGYANRDSLSYRKVYGLETIPTIFRGTLRGGGFCDAWNCFVQLGLTDDSYKMEHSETLTPRMLVNAFLPYDETMSVENKFKKRFPTLTETQFQKFVWLGLFENNKPMGAENLSPAQMLQTILEPKLRLDPEDKDLILMHHIFEYKMGGKRFRLESSLVNIGTDAVYTAMSNTVGLPMGICAKMILKNEIAEKGVVLPISPAIYNPILQELEHFGIHFTEFLLEIN
jgi:saccharopine dehydrogenase-like NADP-dependent oxidoreductase